MSTRMRVPAVLVGLLALAGCTTTQSAVADPPAGGVATVEVRDADLAPARPTSGLPTMRVEQLPPEGVDTLELIAQGRQFPYVKDGSTFSNREGFLPDQPRGFYAEYTVITPEQDDRGARRIVGGDDGSRFYTADHYSSFREVVSG